MHRLLAILVGQAAATFGAPASPERAVQPSIDALEVPVVSLEGSDSAPAGAPEPEPREYALEPLRTKAVPEAAGEVAPEEPEHSEKPERSEKPKKPKKALDIDWKGRVVGGYRLRLTDPSAEQSETPDEDHALQLRQARTNLYGRYEDVLRIKVSADFADLLGKPAAGYVLRDAWANVRIRDAFQVKIGEFKRPYSALELRAVSKIPMVSRGLFNSAAIEDLYWAERGAGLMLWGKYDAKRPGLDRLDWYVSATQDATSGAPEGVDVHARVTYAPIEMLRVGASGAFKYVEDYGANWRHAFAGNVDVTFKYEGLRIALEADLAQDWSYQEPDGELISPNMVGLLGYLSYDLELPKRFVLQPAASFEFVDTNMLYQESEAMRVVGNLNLRWTDHLMLRPQVEYIRPFSPVTDNNLFVESQIYGLWLQVQL